MRTRPLESPHWLAAVLVLLCSASALAREGPRTRVTWVETPPVLDGVLDDAAWQGVPVVDDFRQAQPDEGEPATQYTEVRIVTDGRTLYFGVRLHDDDIGRMVQNRGRRDDLLFWDDRFNVVIDPFHDHRTGYFLQVNSVGQRRDGLIEGSNFEQNWDGIWDAEVTIDAEGWTLEMAIPFATVAFDPERDDWGLNMTRGIRRNSENSWWANPSKDRFESNLCCAGVLEGMSGVSHGLGLDLVPGFALRHRHRPRDPAIPQTARDVTLFDPTLDAFYRLTPGLTGALSVNTDFGDAEVDERLVNLDQRFALFFPEKRDFFLRDALVFDFGGLSSIDNEDKNGLPYFSRRIGLEDDIIAAGKVTGRHGDWNVGLLDAHLTGMSDNLFVGRISRNLLEESRVGVIVTHGDPETRAASSLVGADFQFRTGNWGKAGRVLQSNLWFQNSFTQGSSGMEGAWGAEIRYPNDTHNWLLGYKELQRTFRPALGFVNRADIRRYEGSYRYRSWHSGPVRILDHEIDGMLITDLRNEVESTELELSPLTAETPLGDKLIAAATYRFELLDAATPFLGGTFLPEDRYHFVQGSLRLETSFNRRLRGIFETRGGQFFDGQRIGGIALLEWRPSWHYAFSLEYEQDTFWLTVLSAPPPLGVRRSETIRSRIGRVRIEFIFTKDVFWTTLAQYDNQTDQIGINSRLRWMIEEGREIFLVLNQGFVDVDGDIRAGETEGIAKVGWTLRF